MQRKNINYYLKNLSSQKKKKRIFKANLRVIKTLLIKIFQIQQQNKKLPGILIRDPGN